MHTPVVAATATLTTLPKYRRLNKYEISITEITAVITGNVN